MLLRVLRTNHAYHFILIPLMAVLLWLPSMMAVPTSAPAPSVDDYMLFYRPIANLVNANRYLSSGIALAILILMSFFMIRLNVKYAFIRIRTFLPASLLVILSSAISDLHTMQPAYIGALFVMISINRIFDSYEKEKIYSNGIDTGLLLSIGSLFYLNLLALFPLIWISFMAVRKKMTWRDFILPLLGFLLPWIFTAVGYYVFGNINSLIDMLDKNLNRDGSFLKGNYFIHGYLGLLGLLTILSSAFFMARYDEKKISSRKFFLVFFWIFLFATAALFAAPPVSVEMILIISIPLSFLFANYFVFMRRQFWGGLFLYILLGTAILLQFSKVIMP